MQEGCNWTSVWAKRAGTESGCIRIYPGKVPHTAAAPGQLRSPEPRETCKAYKLLGPESTAWLEKKEVKEREGSFVIRPKNGQGDQAWGLGLKHIEQETKV